MTRALPKAAGLQFGTAGGINIDFRPSPVILAGRIDKLGLDIRSFKEPLQKAVRDVMIPSIRRNFEMGGRPQWAPLSSYTLERKSGSDTLIESGALMNTMGHQNIWTITKDYAVIKDLPNSIWYGKVHQAGASTGGGKALVNVLTKKVIGAADAGGEIPARPFVVLQKEDQRKIESIFRHWLDERIRANMGRF